MKDKDFLRWLHDRLISTHNEPSNVDYMLKLKSIIDNMDPEGAILTPLGAKPKEGDLCWFWMEGEEDKKVKGYYIGFEVFENCGAHIGSITKIPEFGKLIAGDNVRLIEGCEYE